MKKKKKFKLSKEFLKKEKRLGKIHSIIIIFFLIIKFIYWFFRKQTIGGNTTYFLYTLWIPLFAGFIFLFIYRWNYMKAIILSTKAYLWKAIYIFFFVGFGLLTSVVVPITVADVIWEYYNHIEIKEKYPKSVECEVLNFWRTKKRGRTGSITYKFQDQIKYLHVDYKYYGTIKDNNPKYYKLELILREGLNETFVVDSWRLIKK